MTGISPVASHAAPVSSAAQVQQMRHLQQARAAATAAASAAAISDPDRDGDNDHGVVENGHAVDIRV